MIIILLFIFIFALLYLKFSKKIKVKWATFFRRHILAQSDRFGVYCFHGKQGQGKTYCAVKFLSENSGKMPIVSNIHLKNIKYTYCNDFDEILEIAKAGGYLIFYDEIFSKYNKNSPSDKVTLNFLSQMRKRGNILLTTAQDWLELPVWLRRKVKIDIACRRRNILKWTVITEKYGDADNMKWDKDENEYVSPILMTSVSLMNKNITDSYDTFETVEVQGGSRRRSGQGA